jgi:peptidoglycan/LPS O-acetylase OafA/YrhL
MSQQSIANPSTKHLPVLDGVRGIAVLAVMMYHNALDAQACHFGGLSHYAIKFFSAGYVGVDMFFVLSGFLITNILLQQKGVDLKTYLKRFYARRALRIFPLFYAVLIIVLLVVRPVMEHQENQLAGLYFGPDIALNVWWLWLDAANIAITLKNQWLFGNLSHFWTLAVEEQFYIVWPFLVYALPTTRLGIISGLLVLVAFASRIFYKAVVHSSVADYVFTPCRMDQLACGALLAVVLPMLAEKKYHRAIMGVAAFAITCSIYGLFLNVRVYSLGVLANNFAYFYELALPSIIGIAFASVMALALHNIWPALNNLLASPVLGFFGKYSYGLYVISHLVRVPDKMLPALFSPDWAGQFQFAAYCFLSWSLSIILAIASFHLLEKPFLRLKDKFRN